MRNFQPITGSLLSRQYVVTLTSQKQSKLKQLKIVIHCPINALIMAGASQSDDNKGAKFSTNHWLAFKSSIRSYIDVSKTIEIKATENRDT